MNFVALGLEGLGDDERVAAPAGDEADAGNFGFGIWDLGFRHRRAAS